MGWDLSTKRIESRTSGQPIMFRHEQAAFLINMGLVTLVTAGTISVQDLTEEQFKEEILKQHKPAEGNSAVTFGGTEPSSEAEAQAEFLKVVDPTKLHQA